MIVVINVIVLIVVLIRWLHVWVLALTSQLEAGGSIQGLGFIRGFRVCMGV